MVKTRIIDSPTHDTDRQQDCRMSAHDDAAWNVACRDNFESTEALTLQQQLLC